MPANWRALFYFLGRGLEGGLFPLPPPDGLPVVLGPFGGRVVVFVIMLEFILFSFWFVLLLSIILLRSSFKFLSTPFLWWDSVRMVNQSVNN